MDPEIPVPEAAVGFICKAVLQTLKSGVRPSEEEAYALNRLPLIERLRESVAETDLDGLLVLARDAKLGELSRALCVSMLQRHCTRPEVIAVFKELFKSSQSLVKARIVWRLADSAALEPEWHENLQAFVRTEWDAFVTTRYFQSGGVPAIEGYLRAQKPTFFPDSKRWVYLSLAVAMVFDKGVEEQTQVRSLVAELAADLAERDQRFLRDLVAEKLTLTA